MPANLENSAMATGLEKVTFIPIPKKGSAKECSNYYTIALISHASKVMLKILQARLQQYMNWELPDVQAGFRKGRGTIDQIANICWIIEKAREFQKHLLHWLHESLWLCGSQQTVENSSRDGNTRLPYLPLEKPVSRSRSNRTRHRKNGKLGNEYVKAIYCHLDYLTYMQNISCEMPDWMNHKLESRLPGEISTPADMQMTPPLW